MKTRIISALTACCVLVACVPDEEEFEMLDNPISVDAALQPYFDAFKAAANERGITVDASFYEIDARIESIDDGDVIGECWYGGHGPNEIRIDSEFWGTSPGIDREFVVFHELGHCYLDRDHTEATTANGSCVSIMASGTGDCRNRYNASTREWYLDELFQNH